MKFEWDWDFDCWSWGTGKVQGWIRDQRLNYSYRSIHLGPLTIQWRREEWIT